ncbi:flagellar protein FlaG [Anaerophilus nitritogenes]|uniref:flagellar protein FlaG n=1 Tax=Anaerophilus nitritogenes TaxID=2498136 RepID=UPI00101C2DC8|nr:flagellar protein FlaG [Anaerophilus nitritogenes]
MKIDGGVTNFSQNSGTNPKDQIGIKKTGEENQVLDQMNQQNCIGEQELIKSIEKANKDLVLTDTSLQFSIHEKTKQVMVKIINNNNKEVIREIPSEKILDMVAAMIERTGLFVDQKA